MSIDVVIVNWNSGDRVAACVHSLLRHDRGEISSITVVDNQSADGSADGIVAHDLVNVVAAGSNLGFGRACNLGATLGEAPFLLFLNPDCAVFEGSLSGPLAFLTGIAGQPYAVAGIRLLDAGGMVQRHCARFPGPGTMIADATGLARLAPRVFPPLIMTDFAHENDCDVDHVIGAFYMVRRRAFEAVGGFDRRFFMYMEDLDLSRRLSRNGGRVRYLFGPSAFHEGGGTSGQILGRRLGYSMIARMIYSRIHFTFPGKLAVLIAIAFAEPVIRLGRSLATGGGQGRRQILEGIAVFWRWLLNSRMEAAA